MRYILSCLRCPVVTTALVLLTVTFAVSPVRHSSAQDGTPDATVEIEQAHVGLIFSANIGGGTIHMGGTSRNFTIGGLGVGGLGISSFEASGEVYGLKSIEDFEGAYAVGRYGAVAGSTEIPGEMWLYNAKGVEVHLRTRREGLMLSVGADGVLIKFD